MRQIAFITVFVTEFGPIAFQLKRSSGLRRDAAKAGNNAKNTATGNNVSTRRASANSSVKIGRDRPTFCCKTQPATKVPKYARPIPSSTPKAVTTNDSSSTTAITVTARAPMARKMARLRWPAKAEAYVLTATVASASTSTNDPITA